MTKNTMLPNLHLLVIILFLFLFRVTLAENVFSEVERLQALLEQTPLESPFRSRIENNLRLAQESSNQLKICNNYLAGENFNLDARTSDLQFNRQLNQSLNLQAPLRKRQDENNMYAFTMLEESIHIFGPQVDIKIFLFQFNDLNVILNALQIAHQSTQNTETLWEIQKVGLFEISQRLHPAHSRYQNVKDNDILLLSEILRLSVYKIFTGGRVPIQFRNSLNPLKHIEYLLLFEQRLKINTDQKLQLVAALIAGIDAETFSVHRDYFENYVKEWKWLRRNSWFRSKFRTTQYDEIVTQRAKN